MSGSSSILDRIANPTTLNVLGAYDQAAQAARGIWANRQAQAQQAAGEAYQQATDPQTGLVDPAKAQALIAADPRAALAAQSSATSGQALQTANTAFNQGQQAAIGRTIGSVLTDPEQTPEKYRQALDYSLANHGIDQSHYDAALSALKAVPSDPTALRKFGTRLLVGTLAGPDMARTVMPTNQDINTGATVQPVVRQPAVLGGGMTQAPGAVPLTTSPETRAALNPVWQKDPSDPTGQRWIQVPVPRSALPNATGTDQPAGSPPAPIPGNGAYRPRGTVIGGTAPQPAPAPTPPSAASGQGQAAPATPPASSQTYLTQPPQGQQEGVNADVAAYKADQQAVPGINTGLQNLTTAKQALALTQTGRSTEAVHNFYSFLKSQGLSPGFLDNDVTQYDIARKAMLAYASGQGKAAGTDLGLEAQLHSNASPDIDQSAADHVINQNIGLQRQKLAQVMEAPAGGVGYGNHVTNFTGKTDPRAFAWDVYSPAERAAIIAQSKTVEGGYQKLKDSLKIAVDRHLVQVPTAAGP